MTLQLNAETLTRQIHDCSDFLNAGQLVSVQGVISAKIQAPVGELCSILVDDQHKILAEVIGFKDNLCQLMPFQRAEGLMAGQTVVALNRRQTIPVGRKILGRVVNGMGEAIDGKSQFQPECCVPCVNRAINPMQRPKIDQPICTGQKAIDGLLTIGRGQRIGLFAGSGVGKSTLLGEIARNSSEQINVVALIGERGREIRPFLEEALGPKGLARSVVVVATVEQPALVRIRAAQTALAIASWFRDSGNNVMLMLDSLTRIAAAQRELGLLLNEPPTSRGYPPSVFQLISNLVEQMGTDERGAITAVLTVLVDGDDMNEPVADAARSVLDGHVVLTRELAHKNHFPAIDVNKSISRVARQIVNEDQNRNAAAIREILATYHEVKDLVRIGSYQHGASSRVDLAIKLKSQVDAFLTQSLDQPNQFEQTNEHMRKIASQWYS